MAFTVAGIFKPEFLIGLYTRDSVVIQKASEYLRIVALSYPLMAVSFACQMAYRSTEHVILPMTTTAISFVLNVAGNAIFIFGVESLGIPQMGVAGDVLRLAVFHVSKQIHHVGSVTAVDCYCLVSVF